MRLRIKLWPQGMMSGISARPSGMLGGMARKFFSWQALGAALLGLMLAKWTWVMLAPASPAMPPAAWETADDAGRLFGTARVQDAPAFAPMGNIKLIGVFAHRTRGFAVMQVEEKQIGVGLGDEIKPGVRLVETLADHVMIEQAGVRQRVDLAGASAPVGGPGAPPGGMAAAGGMAATPPGAMAAVLAPAAAPPADNAGAMTPASPPSTLSVSADGSAPASTAPLPAAAGHSSRSGTGPHNH